MEGLFSRGHWVKDVLKDEGHLRFMSWLNSPALPYDFCELREGHNLRNLMVILSEGATGGQVVQPLITATKEIVDEITANDLHLPVVDPNSSDADVAELNRLLSLYTRLQSHLAVLGSIYNPQPSFQGRVIVPFTGTFNLKANIDFLRSLGTIVRYISLSLISFLTLCAGTCAGEETNSSEVSPRNTVTPSDSTTMTQMGGNVRKNPKLQMKTSSRNMGSLVVNRPSAISRCSNILPRF